jgi:hypothetical protein
MTTKERLQSLLDTARAAEVEAGECAAKQDSPGAHRAAAKAHRASAEAARVLDSTGGLEDNELWDLMVEVAEATNRASSSAVLTGSTEALDYALVEAAEAPAPGGSRHAGAAAAASGEAAEAHEAAALDAEATEQDQQNAPFERAQAAATRAEAAADAVFNLAEGPIWDLNEEWGYTVKDLSEQAGTYCGLAEVAATYVGTDIPDALKEKGADRAEAAAKGAEQCLSEAQEILRIAEEEAKEE